MKNSGKSGIQKKNYQILLIGIILITIGYLIMATGESTISPIILIIAYAIIIPIALLYPTKNE